ncbi:Ribosomal protein S8 [Spironucleus salmonicida]|uniref:Ribosomal protein S8 n=1 Tax=Spironucleus salmonicida TaxID=348837 RepID=V6LX76_9EUKA|nr:Ribosomal protein S8 [Spironucleus salmonicida]|eukprot:EST45424.1 Putative 40S ribosomal protein S8 [Spironucleus salmonicida]
MAQGDYIKLHQKRHGKRLDHDEKMRKKEARMPHIISKKATHLIGLRQKLFSEERRKEKIELKKKIRQNNEKSVNNTTKNNNTVPKPAFLLDRETENRAKILSNTVKQKKKQRSAQWSLPISQVNPLADSQVFKVLKSGKRGKKEWKRKINMATFSPLGATRKAPKFERFIKPSALRYRFANVVHPELKATHQLEIIGVKKNPSSQLYTELNVLTKGTVIEVNVADLGLVTAGGKVVWGKYAQISNNPERDGCINAVLLV